MKKHIVFDVSGHGFGHFVQAAAVINKLGEQYPELRLTIRTTVAPRIVEGRIKVACDVVNHSTDFGMLMDSALDVDREESFLRYQQLHQNYEQAVIREAGLLSALKPDLLFSNVSYLSVAAAKHLGLPVVAMCSLNWADIFKGYFNSTEAETIYQQMVDSYNQANVFLCPEPSMAMPNFCNVQKIAPLSSKGCKQRDQLMQFFPDIKNAHIVLVAPGGIPTPLPVEDWPHYNDVVFVTTWGHQSQRNDMIDSTQLSMEFIDLLKSVDVVLTKPGYGTVAEAMCNHVPMMYVCRNDWPEEPFLVDWLNSFGKVLEITRQQMFSGEIKNELDELLSKSWMRPAPVANGEEQAVKIIAELVF
ncbi:MAG: hypothetical protein OEX19_15440 [Gammaproteobacteria bacterium]|nr:hypothetical protein [Gammaproteobacteria bacterium]